MTRGILAYLFLYLTILSLHGQNIPVEPEHLVLANEIRELYEDAEVTCNLFSSTYKFQITESGGLMISEKDHKELIALKSNVDHHEQIYYNDQIKVKSSEFRNLKNRKTRVNTWCGHYSSNGIFHSDAQLCNYTVAMARKGEYVVMESELEYKDPRYFTTAHFQNLNPVRTRKIEFIIPDEVDVELVEYNFDGKDITKEEKAMAGYRTITYSLEFLDGFKDGPNIPGYSYFMPHIMVLTKGYTLNGEYQDVLSSTTSLYRWYKSLVDQRHNDIEALKPLVTSITAGKESDDDKIKAIYYWVQDNIKYIAFENGIAGFKPEDSNKVYANKYGDCKGMANLTAELLKIAGYDARLAWIGTDFLNYTYDTPSLAVDNHMICAVRLENDFLFLDATDKNNSYRDNSEQIQGKQVMVENGDDYLILEIPIEPLDKYLQQTEVSYRLGEDEFKAMASESISGELKKQLTNLYGYIRPEKYEIFYKTIAAGNFETAKIELVNDPVLDREEPFELIYDISMENSSNQFGNEIYLDLDFKKDLKDRKIEVDRKIPYKFESRINRKFNGKLEVPEGMKVSHLPDNLNLRSEYFEFNLGYEIQNNVICYRKELKVFKNLLPAQRFKEWNHAIDQLRTFYNDQIILSKE